jgi:hypothetical protein
MVSFEKSTIPNDASTRVEFLGVLIDTEWMCVFAAPHKIASLSAIVAEIVQSRVSVKVRRLASVLGKLNSLEVASGPAVLVGTRIVSLHCAELLLRESQTTRGEVCNFVLLGFEFKFASHFLLFLLIMHISYTTFSQILKLLFS